MNAAPWKWIGVVIGLLLLLGVSAASGQQAAADAEVVETDYLNLRAAPTTTSAVLTLLAPETPLTIVGVTVDHTWLQVRLTSGITGWVAAQYVNVHIDLNAIFPSGGSGTRLPDDVVAHIRQVYAAGQQLGNHADVFAKVGDSITVSIFTLNPIGDGLYNLGDYAGLQAVIDYFSRRETRSGVNSFNDTPIAAKIGWTTFGVLDPDASDPGVCQADELPLLCAYRVLQPAFAIIMFGTNDVGILDANDYRANLNRIVALSEAQGVIPILSTFPQREGYEERSQIFNTIVVQVAAAHAIPLLDYGGAMLPLGRGGFDADGVHPSPPPNGYEGAADFRAENLHYGYVIRNLTALQLLDAVWRAVTE